VGRLVPCNTQPLGQSDGKLSVHEKPGHQAATSTG
jgi:hypothetical protein